MSDNAPLDSGSPTDTTSTGPSADPNTTDPDATDPTLTGPPSTDPTSTNPTDPNTGATNESGTTTEPNTGNTSGSPTGQPSAGPNARIGQDSEGSTSSASDVQTTVSVESFASAIPTASNEPSANSNTIDGTGNRNGHHGSNGAGFESQSNSFRKAIIIASGVSGAVGVILVVVVILFVYRRRNRRRDASGGSTAFVSVASTRPPRPASETWIGTRTTPVDSFNEEKLELGDRVSKADSLESQTTLADITIAHSKYAFSTPTHSPRPSVDKLKKTGHTPRPSMDNLRMKGHTPRPSVEDHRITSEAIVPRDPFGAPQMSIVNMHRSQPHAFKALPIPRPRKAAPGLRVSSTGSFIADVVAEQGDAQPSPDLPLVTPVDAPSSWRNHLEDYTGGEDYTFVAPPARRDSMASLSRQSSRASSRNSRNLEEIVSPRKKTMFSVIAKKRRSRADSIDPFRKSAAAARRKSTRSSRMEGIVGIVRRKSGRTSRSESVKTPTTPSNRSRSRAPSFGPSTTSRSSRSRAPSVAPSTPRRRSQATTNGSQIFSTSIAGPPGLPKTPRTPTAPRQSRVIGQPIRTPRTSGGSFSSVSQTSTSMSLDRESRTPTTTPSAGARARTPRAAVPRTPTSLEDAHWEAVPVPHPLPTQTATATALSQRPLPAAPVRPRTPKTPRTARAELSLSQVSRALSEVSRESSF